MARPHAASRRSDARRGLRIAEILLAVVLTALAFGTLHPFNAGIVAGIVFWVCLLKSIPMPEPRPPGTRTAYLRWAVAWGTLLFCPLAILAASGINPRSQNEEQLLDRVLDGLIGLQLVASVVNSFAVKALTRDQFEWSVFWLAILLVLGLTALLYCFVRFYR